MVPLINSVRRSQYATVSECVRPCPVSYYFQDARDVSFGEHGKTSHEHRQYIVSEELVAKSKSVSTILVTNAHFHSQAKSKIRVLLAATTYVCVIL